MRGGIGMRRATWIGAFMGLALWGLSSAVRAEGEGPAASADFEAALAKETQLRIDAETNMVATWKLLQDCQKEVEQLRARTAENAQAAVHARDVQRQLDAKTAEWMEQKRQMEALQAEQIRLRRQLSDLRESSAGSSGPEGGTRLLQDEINRLAQALGAAQEQNKVLTQARELMVQRQAQEYLDQGKAISAAAARATQMEQENARIAAKLQALEKRLEAETARAESLEREKAGQAQAALAAAAQSQNDLGTLQSELEAKSKALAEVEKQVRKLKREVGPSAAQVAEAEKRLAKEQAAAAAQAQEFEKRLAEEKSRAAASLQDLEKRLAEEKARAAAQERDPAAQGPTPAEMEELRQEAASLRATLKERESALDQASEQMKRLWASAAESEQQLPARRASDAARKAAEAKVKSVEAELAKAAANVRKLEKAVARAEKRLAAEKARERN
ncbi:MAG: hypothetical protein AB7V14_01880 [Kiritimatiellia bacterium]